MQHGGGEILTPYSKYVDLQRISTCTKDKSRAATPSTVTTVISLSGHQSKRSLKTYLREKLFPVNHDIRSVLFKVLIKRVECNKSMFCEEMYTDFITQNKLNDQTSAIPLPSFVDQDDSLPVYYLNSSGVLEMKKILWCIGYHFPHISRCQLLPFVISLLLHYDDSPSQVYVHACYLIFAKSKSVHYIDLTGGESEASALLLKELCQRFTATSHKSLMSLTADPESVYNHWLKCIFNGLPFTTIVVLFDMYLLEGYKALYRVALAILKFYRKIGISNPSDIVSAVFEFCQTLDAKVNIVMLFRKAFSFKLMPSKDIKKMHKKIQSSIKNNQLNSSGTIFQRNPWDYIALVRDVKSTTINETLLSTLYCWIPEMIALNKPTLLFSTDRNGYNIQTFFSCVYDYQPTILLVKTLSDEVFGAYLSNSWNEGKDNPHFFGTGETFVFSLLPETKAYKWVGITDETSGQVRKESQNLNPNEKVLPPVKPPAGIRDCHTVTLPPIHHENHAVHSSNAYKTEQVTLPPLFGTAIVATPQPHDIREQAKADMFMMVDGSGIMIGGGGGGYAIYIDSQLRNGNSQHCATFNNRPLVVGEDFTCSVVEVFGFEGTV